MKYPLVLNEAPTLESCFVNSISRFGDGELRLAIGGTCISQRHNPPKLQKELRDILVSTSSECLVAIPNINAAIHKKDHWRKYGSAQYVNLYREGRMYGSSFITRPDSAPWIDSPEYWSRVRDLWKDKDVVLVVGDKKSITQEMVSTEAKSCREVWGPKVEAYAHIDRIEEEIGTPSGVVILCLGATATVLAARLSKKGVHALDLGHVGMFMKHAGAYRYMNEDLISAGYKNQITTLHKTKRWGADGAKHTAPVQEFAAELRASSVLDYGCGEGKLAKSLPKIKFMEYDPGIPGKDALPKPADLVVCTDVLEHIEPEKISKVLDHLYRLAAKGCYLVIATRPANALLPDGRNAHLIVQPWAWWMDKLLQVGWTIKKFEQKSEKHDVSVWLMK